MAKCRYPSRLLAPAWRYLSATTLVGLSVWLVNGRSAAQQPVQPGDPLPGLTASEFEEFRIGLEDFLEVEEAEEGLGPAFNGTSCAACHNVPALGGIAPVTTVRAGIRQEDGSFRDIDPARGSLFQLFSIPTHGCQSVIPPEANVIARRVPIPLFGAGLVEAIPDQTLLALEDPLDLDRDGVSGRAAIVIDLVTGDRSVGRFGWKAQIATLLVFSGDAYRSEMGITNDLFPAELTFELSEAQLKACDPIPDPEDFAEPGTGRRGIDNFESFMKFLAPISRGPVTDQVAVGQQVFAAIGCTSCHMSALQTGRSSNPLFDRRLVRLYSDLLLHDVGTGDGIQQGAATPDEIRTPALWGLRFRRPLLHDGSAATTAEAVERHSREAQLAKEGFDGLTPSDHQALMAFLNSL